jgi:hypothetical protein
MLRFSRLYQSALCQVQAQRFGRKTEMIGWNASNAATTGTTTDMARGSATEMGIEAAIADKTIEAIQTVSPNKEAMPPDWTGEGTTLAIADLSIQTTRATIAMETAATARNTAAKKLTARLIARRSVAATRSDIAKTPATAAGNEPPQMKPMPARFMKTTVLTAILLLMLSPGVGAWYAQEAGGPLTKQEIFSRLKDAAARHSSQADIAAEINHRGIDFTVDQEVLNQFRQAGARSFLLDTIQRSGKNLGQPQVSDPEIPDEAARQKTRDELIAKLPLIEQARQHAFEFAEELPNFIVTQSVTRYSEAPGNKDWQQEDRLEIELTYRVGKGEEFKLLRVDGKPARQTYQEIGGSTSTGEFGTMLAALFVPQSKAEFKEVRRESFHGRPTVVFDFKVRRANSSSSISDKAKGKTVVAGYSGSIWIDTESKRALRIESSSEEIPAGFPVTLAESAIEYDWVPIGSERYLLPVHAEVLLGWDAQKVYTKNVIEFRDYRRFEAKIKIDPN